MYFFLFIFIGYLSVVLEIVVGEYKDNVLVIFNNVCCNIKRRVVFFFGDIIKGLLYL